MNQTCYPTDNNYKLWKNTKTNLKELSEDTMESDQKQAETERENFMLERGEHHWARSTFIWVSLEVKRWGSS